MKRNVGDMSEEGGGGKRRMVQNQRSKEKKIQKKRKLLKLEYLRAFSTYIYLRSLNTWNDEYIVVYLYTLSIYTNKLMFYITTLGFGLTSTHEHP